MDEEEPTEQILTPQEIIEIKDAFLMYGEVSLVYDESGRSEQVLKMPHRYLEDCLVTLGIEPAECELAAFHRELSDNQHTEVEFNKFLESIRDIYPITFDEETLKAVFSSIDYNSNGYLTAKDVRLLYVTAIGLNLTDEELDDMMKEVDLDGDGKISMEEYMYFFTPESGNA